MYYDGFPQLCNAMEYIFSEEARDDNIQFSEEDSIDMIPFESIVHEMTSTNDGTKTDLIMHDLYSRTPYGGTAIYDAAIAAINVLKDEDRSKKNVSVILMTDGEGNVGKESTFVSAYKNANRDIPVYSIMFGDADSTQLEEIAKLTNAKVFDGKVDLV